MRQLICLRSILGIAVVISLFTACSGTGSKTMPPVGLTSEAVHGGSRAQLLVGGPLASPGVIAPSGGTNAQAESHWLSHLTSSIPLNIAVLYVSGANCSCVLVYSQRGRDQAPIGIIRGLINPRGLFVDKEGELYVANSAAHGVMIYEEGDFSKPVETLTGTVHPSDVTRDGDDHYGTIYVVNQNDANGGPGNISVYANGSTNPTSYLDTHANSFIDSVALDAKHNLFAGYGDQSGVAHIDEFKNGSTQPIQLPAALGYTGGIEVDNTHDLLVADPDFFNGQNAPAVDIFSIVRRRPEFQFGEEGWPYYVAVTKREQHMYVSDARLLQVREYTYPGGVLLDTITKGFENGNYPIGVAVAHPGPL
jgi:hypothetical protein